MANTTLGVVTESANESTYVWLTKADDEITTSFTIDWGDGSAAETSQATTSPVQYSHTYSTAGSYTATITVSAGELKIQNIDTSELSVSGNVISLSTGDGLTVIGENAFMFWGDSDTTTLRTVTFGDALTTLENQAFEYASGLATITIPPNVTIGDYAFSDVAGYNDGSLSVVIGAGCTIGEYAFSASSIESLTISPGITSIGTNALANIDDLVDITIPSSVTYIGKDAFHNMYALESATIKATIPPELEESGGEPQYPFDIGSIPIYVPRDSLTAYQTTPGWSDVAEYYVGADIDPDPEPTPPGPEPVVITGKEFLNDAGVMTLIGFIQYALATKQEIMQVSELAEASEDLEDKIYQYIGETTASYTNGFFYKCVASGAAYIWQEITFGGGSGTGDIQVTTIPTASSELLGTVYQYIGATDSTYTHGFFYECVSDGQSTPTYSWQNVAVNITPPVASGSNDGLMTSAMYTKLDNITTASSSNDGLMSMSMYDKLDGIALATTSDIDAIFS